MKKLIVLFAVVVSVVLWSCGGGSGKSGQSTTSQPDEEQTLYTQEGMMKALKELNIAIPNELQYDTVRERSIHFKAKSIDATTRKQLDEQYKKICDGFVADGWEGSAEMENNINMGGIFKMGHRYKKLLGDGKKKKIVIISTDYFEDSGDFALKVTYYPKY